MGLLNSFQLGSGMFDLNGATMADPSIPSMPLGSGMFGMNQSPIPAATTPTQPNMMGLLGLGKSMLDASQQQPQAPHMPMMAHNSGPISFLPQSGITMPYTTGSAGLQGLLQQMQNAPFGR